MFFRSQILMVCQCCVCMGSDAFILTAYAVDLVSPNCIVTFTPLESFVVQMCLPIIAGACFWSRYAMHCTLWISSKQKKLPRWMSCMLTPKQNQQELESSYDHAVKQSTSVFIVVYNVRTECGMHVCVLVRECACVRACLHAGGRAGVRACG